MVMQHVAGAIVKDNGTDISTSYTTDTDSIQVTQSTLDITQMSCSQLLREMMRQQQQIWDLNDTELSNLLLDVPISSFTGLLAEENNFKVQNSTYVNYIVSYIFYFRIE